MTYDEWKQLRRKSSGENYKAESGQTRHQKISYEDWKNKKSQEAAERRKAEQNRRQRADNVQSGKQYGETYKQLRDRLDQSDRAGRYNENYVESDGTYIRIDSTPHKDADRQAEAHAEQGKPWWRDLTTEARMSSGFQLKPDIDTQYIIQDMAQVFEQDKRWQQPDERWDEEARNQFRRLYSQDPEQAKQYAADMNGFLDYLAKEEKRKALAQEAVDKPWLSTAKAIGAQALGGFGEYVNDVAENLGRGRITERGTRLSPTEYAGAVTGAISEDLNRKHGTIDGSVYEKYRMDDQALRDAGIDPTVHRFATDVLGRQVLDGKGWGDAYQLGTSAAQSMMWAPVAKVGGAAGQLMSMVSYFGQAAASGVDDARARDGSDEQALVYGALMGLAETAAEQIDIRQLNALGNAVDMRELLTNMAKQGISEALEEGVTSVVGTFADELVMQDKSQRNLRILEYMENGMTEEEANRQAWNNAVNDALESVLGGFISGSATGGATTAKNSAITNLRYGNATLDNMVALVQEGMAAPEGSMARTMAQEYEQQLFHGRELSGVQIQRLAQELQKQTVEQSGTEQAQEDSPMAEPEAMDIREKPDAQEVAEEPAATDQDGLQVEEDDVPDTDVGDTDDDVLAELSDLGLHEEEARVLRENFRDTEMDRSDYVTGVRTAFQYGQLGIPARELERPDSAAGSLAEYQRITAYKYGRLHGQQQAQAEQKNLAGKTVADHRNVEFDGDWSRLNDAQMAGITAVNALGETLGVRYRFYESYQKGKQRVYLDENGVEKNAPNGFYKDGVIHLDVNAGNSGQGTVLFTAAHEMTHFIREWSPEKFRVLADALMEGYAGTDTNVEQLINEKIAAYRDSGENLSFEQAFEEVVADSMETMLSDGSFAERVQKLKQTDRTLWEKIRDWFMSMADSIRKAYENLKPDSREGQLVAEMVDTAEKLKELFAEAAVDAAGNLQRAEKNTADEGGEVRHSLRIAHSDGTTELLTDARSVTDGDVLEYLKLAKASKLYDRSYIPVRSDTPKVIIDTLEQVNEDVRDLSMVMQVRKARQAMSSEHPAKSKNKTGSNIRKHALSPRNIIEIMHNLEDPSTIIYQTERRDKFGNPLPNNVSVFVNYSEEGNEGLAVIEFEGSIDPAYIDREVGDSAYHVVVTLFKPDTVRDGIPFDYAEELLDNPNNYELEIKRRPPVGDANREIHPNASNKLPSNNRVAQDDSGVNTKFSLRTPVEQTKTLVAMHNLTADKLMKAIDLGGFPMPSIAVTRTDIPHTNFGEITLVMDKSTVDPKANRKNTVYSADAWTPTFPRVEYEADTAVDDRVRKTLSRYESRIAPQFQSDLRKIKYGLEDLLNSQGGEQELVRHVMDNYGLKASYLESQGKHVDEVQVEQEIPKKYSEDAIEKYEAMIRVLGTRDPAELGTMPLKDIRDNFGPELEKIVPGISKTGMRLGRFIGQVVDYLMDDGSGPSTETVTDYAATRKAVDDALDQSGYEAWARELYAGIEKDRGIHNGKDRFTPSGRSRSFQQTHLSVTLDNIAKAMAAQNGGNTKNVAGFNGIKTLRAGTAERFKSVQDMHDREGRLKNLSQEEQDALTDELNSRLYDLIDEIDRETGKVGGSNNLMRFDLIGQILMEACETGSYNVADVQKVFRENHHEIGDGTALKVKELLFDVSQMPVNLFEAKPERAVRFDEVLAAVIPENAGKDLKAALAKTGVPVIEYAEGNAQDRMRKVNSVEGARFSLRDPEHQAVQETLQQENEKLRKDVTNLKELVKLQRTVTNGTKFTKTSVEAAAGLLMEKAGVSRGKQELAPILERFYEFVAKNEGYDWSDVAAQTQEAVDWLLEHRKPFDLRNGYLYERDLVAQELMIEVYDSYWRISGLKTPPATIQKESARLKTQHQRQMTELKALHRENAARLPAEHRKTVDLVRQERMAKEKQHIADLRSEYERKRDTGSKRGKASATGTAFSKDDRRLMKQAAKEMTADLTAAEKNALQVYTRHVAELEDHLVKKAEQEQILNSSESGKRGRQNEVVAAKNNAATLGKMIAKSNSKLAEMEQLPIIQRIREKAWTSAEPGSYSEPAATENTPVPNADDSTGAAPAGFDPISHLQYEYGSIPDGENAVRPDDLPVSTDGANRVSRTARTVKGAAATPDEFADLIDKEVVRSGLTYIPISNNDVTQKAVARITDQGWIEARLQWHADVRAGKTGADMTAMGALLLNNAAKAGDKTAWLNILHDYQIMGTNTAQGLQALRILKTLQPNDSLYMIKRSIARMVEDMHLDTEITLDEELMEAYRAAESDQARNETMDKIIKNVAAQIPATSLEKWTALRYVNMLGNFRTQVRNITGNLGMKAVVSAKNAVASGLEQIVYAASGGKYEKTKSVLVNQDVLKAAKADFEQVSSVILDGGKYADAMQGSAAFTNAVQAERQIFKNKALEGYRKVTNWSMEQGDLVFSRSAYARALAGYLKAHGIKGNDFSRVDSDLMDQARLYAIQEAQEATFRDTNWLSSWLSKIGRRPDTPTVGKILSEGIMPFRKTPANVLIRAEEYSPLGMINSVYTSIQAMKKGSDITGSQVINSWAKTLTGTGLFILGMTLQNLGVLVGGEDEDESLDKFESLNGWQNYALVLPDGTNLTIDFLSPAAMPMFMGAQLNKMRHDGGIELKELEGAITSLADPMIQMSMLQGVNDTLENIQYAEDNLGQLLINSCLSYLTQGMTNTLFGQLERSAEDQRMSTFVDKDSAVPNWLQRTLGKASAKTPGWDYNQIPYINAWGEEEEYPGHALNAAYNLLSPSYIDRGTEDDVSRELIRLNEAQSDINVFPQTPDKTITYEDKSGITHEDYNLSAEEYVALAKAQGQTQRKLVEGILASRDYAALSDEDKAKAIQYAYKYARESARIEVILDYSGFSSKWMAEIKGDVAEAIVRKVATGTTDKYTSLSVSTAAHVTELLEGITPEAGHSGVRDIQKLEAVIADRKMSSGEKESVLKDIMGDSLEGKWNDAKKMGVSTDAFIKAYRKYLDTSGKGKKQTVIRYLTGTLRMTEKKAAELYKIFSGAK